MADPMLSVVESPRPLVDYDIAGDDPDPVDPERQEDDDAPETPETRLCHVVNQADRSLSLCGLRRPARSPIFKAGLHWVDCAECLKLVRRS